MTDGLAQRTTVVRDAPLRLAGGAPATMLPAHAALPASGVEHAPPDLERVLRRTPGRSA